MLSLICVIRASDVSGFTRYVNSTHRPFGDVMRLMRRVDPPAPRLMTRRLPDRSRIAVSLGPGPVDGVAVEVHLVLELAAAELPVARVARAMGALQHDRDDVRHDEVCLFEREQPRGDVNRVAEAETAKNRREPLCERPQEEVAGHA